MKFVAEVNVMPLKEILDPQGKVVASSMKKLGLQEIQQVRIGKHILLEVDATDETIAYQKVDQACKELLANPIMEEYQFELKMV